MIVSERQAREAWETIKAACLVDAPEGVEAVWSFPLSKESLTVAYRQAAKVTHPDSGGSLEAFAAVDRAKHILLHWLDRSAVEEAKPHGGVAPCPRCDGKGYMELRGSRFGSIMRKQCPTCQGNGEIYDEKNKDGDRI